MRFLKTIFTSVHESGFIPNDSSVPMSLPAKKMEIYIKIKLYSMMYPTACCAISILLGDDYEKRIQCLLEMH